jgi:hypothetical protein
MTTPSPEESSRPKFAVDAVLSADPAVKTERAAETAERQCIYEFGAPRLNGEARGGESAGSV